MGKRDWGLYYKVQYQHQQIWEALNEAIKPQHKTCIKNQGSRTDQVIQTWKDVNKKEMLVSNWCNYWERIKTVSLLERNNEVLTIKSSKPLKSFLVLPD